MKRTIGSRRPPPVAARDRSLHSVRRQLEKSFPLEAEGKPGSNALALSAGRNLPD
ncbi:MAG: hypothetical protein LBQ54_10140 [Planctomycetaceae bacterium]|nr:hypothetical protein [Planctomycetaceae bacterium]